MEIQQNNSLPPTQPAPVAGKRWYEHKGLIAIAVLAIIAAGVSYIALNKKGTECSTMFYGEYKNPQTGETKIFRGCEQPPVNWTKVAKETGGNVAPESNIYFGKSLKDKYILVNLQTGETKDFLPAGYTLVDQHAYQSFPTFLILKKDDQLYSYNVENKNTSPIFADDLKLKKNEGALISASITQKEKFIIRVNTYDLTQVSEFDGSFPVLSTRSYSYDASVNKIVSINPVDFSSCAEYDSKNQRFFTWPCGEGIGSAGPISITDPNGKNKEEIVTAKDLGSTADDSVKVKYRNGLFFALGNDNGLKIVVIDPQQPNPTKEIYTATSQVNEQIKDLVIYSISIDRSTKTLIVGEDDNILLLKYNDSKQITQSKNIADEQIYANFIFPSDGKLYYQAQDSIRVVNLHTWQLEQSISSTGSFGEITLFK